MGLSLGLPRPWHMASTCATPAVPVGTGQAGPSQAPLGYMGEAAVFWLLADVCSPGLGGCIWAVLHTA